MSVCSLRLLAAFIGAAACLAGHMTVLNAQSVDEAAAPAPGRASVSASHGLSLAASADSELVSVTVTKVSNDSAVLVIGTVQLAHAGTPTNKTVALSLQRGGAALDGVYTARIGTVSRAVSEEPVTLHALDGPPAGTHTYTLRARASHTGAEVGLRRLTAIEVP